MSNVGPDTTRSNRLTPGLSLLFHAFVTNIVPTSLLYLVSRQVFLPLLVKHDVVVSENIPLALLVFLALPVYGGMRIIYGLWWKKRRAAKLGAKLIATPVDREIGNFTVLWDIIHAFNYGYPSDMLEEIMEDHGHIFNFRPVFEDLVVTTEPQYIKAILSTDFSNFVKGKSFYNSNRSVLGSGVFNADDRFHRAMTRPFFNRDRISDFELFDRHAEEIIDLMKNRMKEGYAIDFQDAISRFTLDSATEFLFGSSVNSMSTGLQYPHHAPPSLSASLASRSHSSLKEIRNPSADAFASSFAASQFTISQRIRGGWAWPLGEIFKDKTKENMKVVNAYVEPIIREAVAKNKEARGVYVKEHAPGGVKAGEKWEREVGDDETLLDHLVMCTDDEKVLKDETINILIAGRDTTTSTLTFLFFFLAKYPQVTARLRQEIMEHVGPTRMPVYDDIKNMKYLRAVINETLRLFPVVPFNLRCSVSETVWPSKDPNEKPYYIPPNTRIAYSVFIMHRRKDLWGPDAQEFDPDRFLDERLKKYLLSNNFIFLPFNAGPRICLGQQFAYNEMSFITIRLLQQFSSFTVDHESQPPDSLPPAEWAEKEPHTRKGMDGLFPKVHLTMYNKGGLWLKMHEAGRDGVEAAA